MPKPPRKSSRPPRPRRRLWQHLLRGVVALGLLLAVAYITRHAPRAFWPILNGGELAVLYCFIFLYLSIAGPGPVSLDRLMRKKA